MTEGALTSSHRAGGRIPTLDGLRAVSIVLVLSAHALGTGGIPMNARLAGFAGDLGVRSFFVLSGFLITTLLIRESDVTGTISLPRFYLRRAFRIFPAFYAFLSAVVVLAALGEIHLNDGDLLAAATYSTNFHAHRAWWTGHLWSLAVEEQFYLLWPLALVMLGVIRARTVAVATLVLAPLCRLAFWRMPGAADLADQAFPCVCDALGTGCILALLLPRLKSSNACKRLVGASWFWSVPLLLVMSLALRNPWLRYGVGMSFANVGIALAILRCVNMPASAISRLLERRSIAWLGTLSYSLYLWQQLFLNRHSSSWLHQFPQNVVLALLAACFCHYLVERPFLRLNQRWRVVGAQSFPELPSSAAASTSAATYTNA